MHVQIVTFGLGGASERDFLDAAHQAAPAFSAMGGLRAKVWLENAEEGRYGAIYFWDDRESMETALRRHGHLVEGGPAYSDPMMEHFEVLENLTRQTQPVLDIVEGRAPAARRAAPRPAAAATRAIPAGAGRKPAAPAKKGSGPAARKSTNGASRAAAAKTATAKKPPAKKPPAARGTRKAAASGRARG